MASESLWPALLAGEKEFAIRRMREALERDESPSNTMQLGVAYLWVEDYGAARDHFDDANQRRPKRFDIFYGMAGVARWCLGRGEEAVDQWRTGLTCAYTDVARMGIPLLIFAASVLQPHLIPKADAEKVLRRG